MRLSLRSTQFKFTICRKSKNAGRVAVLPGREATFHSWMQMQIQERLGLLLHVDILRVSFIKLGYIL